MISNQTQYEILTTEEWKTYYSPANICAKDFPIQFALANDENFESSKKKIKELATTKPHLLLIKDNTPFKLTPLMIAIIKGRINDIREIFKRLKKNRELVLFYIDSRDSQGYTAAHHAVPYPEIFEIIKNYGADLSIINNNLGTPSDLIELVSSTEKTRQISSESVFVEHDQTRTSINQLVKEGRLKKVTNIQDYRDIQYVPPGGSWRRLWVLPYNSLESMVCSNSMDKTTTGLMREQQSLIKIYKKYVDGGHKEKLVIKKHPKIPDFGVFSCEDGCKFASMIGLYGGEVRKLDDRSASSYLEGIANGADITNHITRINNGFPNNLTFYLRYKGTIFTFLMASEPGGIPPFAELLSTWGLSYSKSLGFRNPYLILGEDRMLKFFSQDLDHIYAHIASYEVKIFSEPFQFDDDYIKYLDLCEKFIYPMDNPTALIKMHYMGKIPIQKWRFYLEHKKPIRFLRTWIEECEHFASDTRLMLLRFMDLIIETDSYLKKSPHEKKVYDWMVANVEKGGLLKLAKALEKIKIELAEDTLNSWELFDFFVLSPFMTRDYDWAADKDSNPLSKPKEKPQTVSNNKRKVDEVYEIAR